MKKIVFNFTDSHLEQLEEIRIKRNMFDRSEVVRYCLAETHIREFPEYIKVQRDKLKETPETIAAKHIALEEAKDSVKIDRERDKNAGICFSLDGAEITTIDGREYCQYPMYTMSSPHTVDIITQKEPLVMMNPEMTSLQYRDVFGNSGPQAKATVLRTLKNKTK